MSRNSLRRCAVLGAGLAALLPSGAAVARDIGTARCVVTIPDDWGATGSAGESPDEAVTVRVSEVASGRVFVSFQRAFGMRIDPASTPGRTVLFARVGSTMRFYGVAPPTAERACVATVTSSSRGAGRQQARDAVTSLRERRPNSRIMVR